VDPNGKTPGAHTIAARLSGFGYRSQLPRALVAPRGDDALFISPSSRNWVTWMTEDLPRGGGGTVSVQWIARTTFLNRFFPLKPPSSERVVAAVWQGARPHVELLGELRAALEATGLRWDEIRFVVSLGGPGARRVVEALAELGVTAGRVSHGPLPASAPARMKAGPGVCLTLWVSVGDLCSSQCGDDGLCGHGVYLAYCRFTGVIRAGDGGHVPPARPMFEVLIPEHALSCVLATTTDPFAVPAVRPLWGAVIDLLPEESRYAAGRVTTLIDHGFTGALLLGVGVRPAARGASYIVRKLLRRAATEFALARAPVSRLVPLVAAADRLRRVPFGFPALSADARAAVDREAAAVSSLFVSGRALFLERVPGLNEPAEVAREIVRLRSERGVPLPLLLTWCRTEGIDVSPREIAAAELSP
jgi:hypothetical protein